MIGTIINGVLLNMSESAVQVGHHVCTNDNDCIVTIAKAVIFRSFNLFISKSKSKYIYLTRIDHSVYTGFQ